MAVETEQRDLAEGADRRRDGTRRPAANERVPKTIAVTCLYCGHVRQRPRHDTGVCPRCGIASYSLPRREARFKRVLVVAGVAAIAVVAVGIVHPWESSPPAATPTNAVASVAPERVVAGGWTPLTFTFVTSAQGMRDGRLTLSVPTGWAAPSTSAASPGRVGSSTGALSVHGNSISVRGITLPAHSPLTVTYGGGSTGATQPSAVGTYSFAVSTAATSTARLHPLTQAPSVAVAPPQPSCATTRNPAGAGRRLILPNGIAQANLHNTQSSTGSIRQCHNAGGLSTSIDLTSLTPTNAGPAGFPEAAYGYDLYAQPFCAACRPGPFPLPVSRIGRFGSDYRLSASYALGRPSPSSLPLDFIYDLWLERNPSAGQPPQSGDLELIVFLYQQGMADCLPSPAPASFTTRIVAGGRQISSRWQICEIRGGTAATPVAFFLRSPAQSRAGTISLRLADFVAQAGRYVSTDLGSYRLMGVELGGEFDQCSPPDGCEASSLSWGWQISRLALESRTATIPIAFTAARRASQQNARPTGATSPPGSAAGAEPARRPSAALAGTFPIREGGSTNDPTTKGG